MQRTDNDNTMKLGEDLPTRTERGSLGEREWRGVSTRTEIHREAARRKPASLFFGGS
jgi:hypothetical protein